MVDLVTLGLALILVGVLAVVAGTLASSKDRGRRVGGGGVILLGPIPIAFGSDARWTSIAIVLAIVLVALTLLLYVI